MSADRTDSTELTFVRCPSCRSLVSASHTRCKMCGAPLDNSAKADKPGPVASGRVRQRTMSQQKNELSSAAQQIREHLGAPTGEPAPGVTHDDPLSGYIEEVDVEQAEATEATSNGSQRKVEEDEMPAESAKMTPRLSELPPESNGETVKPTFGANKSAEEQSTYTPVREAQTPKPEQVPQKVVVESGSRKGGGLSFGKQDKGQQQAQGAQQQREQRRDQDRGRDQRDQQREPQRESREHSRETETPRHGPGPAREAPHALEGQKKSTESRGRLFGWLVSYASPEGSAIELREGQFFVSGTRLKPNDLLVEHSSVSTPHGIATVSTDTGFEIRDLMSERGIFVRRREADSYQRIQEVVKLNHGDWIRLGDVEFLITLVAHVGMR